MAAPAAPRPLEKPSKTALSEGPPGSTALSNSGRCLSLGHDGAFPLSKYIFGAAGELFRPGRADTRFLAETDQVEPAARGSSRPRSGSARQPRGGRDTGRETAS